MNDIITEIQSWYSLECNGDWEHSFGVKIETLDNPGWSVEIDLEETELACRGGYHNKFDNSESDWLDIRIGDSKFAGAGDPGKLNVILNEFIRFKRSVERKEVDS